MRLLHIDTGREMRGGQHQVLLLLELLRGAGHDCILLSRKDSALQQQARRIGIAPRDASISKVWSLSGGIDLVHAHDAQAHTLAAMASRAPFVVSRRVAFPVGSSITSRWKYRRPARFLAVSQFVADELLRAGIRREKIDVVYDAVDDVTHENHWSPDAPAVALANRDPMKGRDLVEFAAKGANIDVAFSNDLPRDLERASMFLYISRSEGLGSAALLAMSMGVPVIASRVGGLVEIVEDGISGLLVENDPQQISVAIRRLAAEPELACRLIHNGRARVALKFTKRHLLDATLQSYLRALAG